MDAPKQREPSSVINLMDALPPEPNEAARDENLHHERAIIEHPRKLDAPTPDKRKLDSYRDTLTVFGLFAVMMICYALQGRGHWFVLVFAGRCLLASA